MAVANVLPELCVRLYDLVRAGRMEEALLLQRAITPLGRAVTAQFGVPGLKAAMTLAGYAGTEPRRPLQIASAEAVTVLRNLMRELSAQVGVSVLADET